jgi:hypothetical protein
MNDELAPEDKLSKVVGTPVAVWMVFSFAVISSMLLAKELVENLPNPSLRWPAYVVLAALALFNYVNVRSVLEWKFESWRQMRSFCLVCVPVIMLLVDVLIYLNQPIVNIAQMKFNCQPAPVLVSQEDLDFIKSTADGYSLSTFQTPMERQAGPTTDQDRSSFSFQIQKRKDYQDVLVADCVVKVLKFEPRTITGYRPPAAMAQNATFFYFDLPAKEGDCRPHTVEWTDANGLRSITWGERFISLDDNKWSKFVFVLNPTIPGIYQLSAHAEVTTDFRSNQRITIGENVSLVNIDTHFTWQSFSAPFGEDVVVRTHKDVPLVLMNGSVEPKGKGVYTVYSVDPQPAKESQDAEGTTPNP